MNLNYTQKRDYRKSQLILLHFFCFTFLIIGQISNKLFAQVVDFNVVNNQNGVPSSGKITWNQFGPGNAGFGNLLRYHPTQPDRCFVSHDFFNTYGTFNNGSSWTTIKDTDGRGEFFRLSDMVFSTALGSNFGLAIEESRIWRTDDAGTSWQVILNAPWYNIINNGPDAGLDRTSFISKVSTVAIDPSNDNTWYVGGGDAPRGQHHLGFNTMQNLSAANPTGREIDPNYQGHIWKTTNAGTSWTPITSGFNPKAQFNRIIVSPIDSNTVFASSNFGLYKSTNGGTTWTEIGTTTNGFDNYNTFLDMDEYYNPTTGEFVLYTIQQVRYFADGMSTRHEGGIFMSTDNGDSWTKINGTITLDLNQLNSDFRIAQNYYRYIARWFGITEAQAIATYPNIPTDVLQYFNMIETDPSDNNTVYVAHHDPQIQQSILPGRLWKTSDRGTNWTNVARDNGTGNAWSNDSTYWTFRNNPFNDNMVEGHQISSLQLGNSYPLRATRSFAVNSLGHIMLLYAHNTFLSTDGGTTWNQVNEERLSENADGITIIGTGDSNLPGAAIHQDKRLGDGIAYFGSGEHHLWRTTNDTDPKGLDRQAITYINGTQESAASVVTHPFNENIVFTTSERQNDKERVFKSIDGGKNWSDFGVANDAETQIRTNNLIIDPINPDNMYYGASIAEGNDFNKQRGVFVSTDGGLNFARRNTGLPSFAQIEDVIFDPRDNTRASLFTAVQYNFQRSRNNSTPPAENHTGGLFHSSDRGLTWTQIAIPSQIEGVNRVIFDHTNRMYIACGARERAIANGGLFYSDDFGVTWNRLFEAQYVEHVDISSFDHNRIICAFGNITRNPGFYLSEDRGITWTKENNGNGSPSFTRHVEFSETDEEVIYTAIAGSGYSKGAYPNGANSRRVIMSPSTARTRVNQTLQLNPTTAFGLDASTLIYRSTNPSVATVDTNGEVTAVAIGATEILATSVDGRYADYVYIVVLEELPLAGSLPIPGVINAEDFTEKGPSSLPMDRLIPQAGTGNSSGQVLSSIIDPGYTDYVINVSESGNYNFTISASAGSNFGGDIEVLIDGISVGSINTGTTGSSPFDFSVYNDFLISNVSISSGLHSLRLRFSDVDTNDGNDDFLFNIDTVTVALEPILNTDTFETESNLFKLASNPVNTELKFTTNKAEGEAYSIYSISGKLVRNGLLNSSILVDSLAKGIYFIKIKETTIKFVKQ